VEANLGKRQERYSQDVEKYREGLAAAMQNLSSETFKREDMARRQGNEDRNYTLNVQKAEAAQRNADRTAVQRSAHNKALEAQGWARIGVSKDRQAFTKSNGGSGGKSGGKKNNGFSLDYAVDPSTPGATYVQEANGYRKRRTFDFDSSTLIDYAKNNMDFIASPEGAEAAKYFARLGGDTYRSTAPDAAERKQAEQKILIDYSLYLDRKELEKTAVPSTAAPTTAAPPALSSLYFNGTSFGG
jgi:hypothetical protein